MPTDIDFLGAGGIPLVISEQGTLDDDAKRLLERRSKLQMMPNAMEALCSVIQQLG
jgi:hypothetical protein